MKKLTCLLFACALCSAFALAACSGSAGSSGASSNGASSNGAASSSSSDGSSVAKSTGAEVSQADIEKMIVGTWVTADRGGKPELTGEKVVFDIVSDTKARVSAQFELTPGGPLTWTDFWDADVVIDGDTMSWTALREGDGGKTFTGTRELKRVA